MPLWLTLQRDYVYSCTTEVICHLFEDSLIPRAWYHMDRVDSRFAPSQWASYQIRQIVGCACSGNAGNVFPRHRLQRKPLVSDPDIHHGTCVTHVPWCMSGSLTCGGGENVPGVPGIPFCACTNLNFTYLARGPWETALLCNDVSHWLGANLESALTWRLKAKASFHRSLIKNVYLPSRFSVHMVFRHIQYTGIITQRFHRSKYRKQTNELTKKQLTSYRTNLQN